MRSDPSDARPTPCLVVDEAALDHNIATMAAALPGERLRPHVKAFKCTALAARLADHGHRSFTCATLREVMGMIDAGLGDDLLLANETLDVDALSAAAAAPGRVTIAIDSDETLAAAVAAGVAEVLIDVNVGLPRCGCDPADAGRLADTARAAGLMVRGVMGYEGHLMMVEEPERKARKVAESMALLAQAAAAVGGDVISAGGTGTAHCNDVATEIQAGSYTLMDTQYSSIGLPFRQALWVEATIISANEPGGWVVADAGLKSLGMDHGNPTWRDGEVLFCSDEHVTLKPTEPTAVRVGDVIRLAPAHVDPTVAKHERMWLLGADGSVTEWPVDLRHW